MAQVLSPDEIPLMRSACQLAAQTLLFIEAFLIAMDKLPDTLSKRLITQLFF